MFDMIKNIFNLFFGFFSKKKPPAETSADGAGGEQKSDILSDLLGRITGGGKDKSALDSLVKGMAAKGLGQVVKSWIAKGPNMLISADQVRDVVGDAKLKDLSGKLGIPEDQVASLLSEKLPDAVDKLTPDGDVKGEFANVIDLTPKQ